MDNLIHPDYEDKGKIFTDVLRKHAVAVIIQTTSNRILGNIHVRPEERIKDELDRPEPTLAITNASIYDSTGKSLIYKTQFLAIQKNNLVWVLPENEKIPGNQGEE